MQNPLKSFCIIGDPISHSLSPLLYTAAFNHLGLPYSYMAFRISPEELDKCISSLRAINISGFNVTIPHKVSILPYLDDLDELARKTNAVNTVKNENGLLKGFNTDVMGFLEPLRKRGLKLDNMRILVLGSGGAARAVLTAFTGAQNVKVYLVNRTIEKAESLAKTAINFGIECKSYSFDELNLLAGKSDLIVNTTPLGMDKRKSILDYEHIRKDCIVYDIVYRPILTSLLESAKKAGAKVIYGYEMLLEQAYLSFEIWTGLHAPRESMKKSLFGMFGEPS